MSAAKLSRGKSCTLCQQRKVRCDLNKPCSNCAKAGAECHVAPLRPPRRRKRKLDERAVFERMKRAESLLLLHGLQVSGEVNDQASDDDEDDEEDIDPPQHRSRSVDPSHSPICHIHTGSPLRLHQHKHELSLVQGESPDTEQEQSKLFRSFNTANILDTSSQFPFVVIGDMPTTALTDQHPNAVQIFQLWQIYLNNVDPLIRLTHAPTLQKHIIAASANIGQVSRPLETLMFNIYLIAIISLPADEVHETFGVSKPAMLRHFHAAAQRSLINAEFMNSSELTVLQAHILYLISIREFTDPGPHYCLIGIAVRVAQRLGAHRDGARFGLPPFEVEQRRRLWWNLLALDKRIAELSGSTISACSTPDADCKRPLNINDSDLHVSSKQPPSPSKTLTEMVFALARFELLNTADSASVRGQILNDRGKSSAGGVSSKHLPRVLAHVNEYAQHIETTRLKSCDPNVPLQLFTQMSIRQGICKLHIQSNVHRLVTKPTTIPKEDRLWLLTEAIKMIEADNILQASPGCRGFLWYSQLHSPFPAYMIFAHELREASSSPEICERAWKALDENYGHRGLMRALQPPIHVGLTKSLVDAWDAWEEASSSSSSSRRPERGPSSSGLIVQLRALLAAHHRDARPMGDGTPNPIPPRVNNSSTSFIDQDNMTSDISIPPPPPMTTIPTDFARAQASFRPAALPNTIDWNLSPAAQMPMPSSSTDVPFDATELDWAAFFPQQFLSDFDQGLL